MTYLVLYLGTKTLGISISNSVLASFYKTIRHDADYEYLLKEVALIVQEEKIDKIVLGYPKNMNNSVSNMAAIVLDFKTKLEQLPIEVILEDERLTSKISNNVLIKGDVSRKKRKMVVDGMASVLILQSYLDRKELNNGR